MPRAGDENLRERIPNGQQRRELPLERRFGADVVTYLDVDELRPPLRDEVDLLFGTASRRRSRSLASSAPGRPRSRTCGPSPCRASPGPAPSRFRNSIFLKFRNREGNMPKDASRGKQEPALNTARRKGTLRSRRRSRRVARSASSIQAGTRNWCGLDQFSPLMVSSSSAM